MGLCAMPMGSKRVNEGKNVFMCNPTEPEGNKKVQISTWAIPNRKKMGLRVIP